MPLQATSGAASYEAFGGGVAAVPNYIEDVFSTQVYTGTGATNNIVNGVDLATYGGLVWTKARTTTSAFTFAHALIDTLRGAGVQICSDRTDANYTQLNSLTSFNSDGYTLGADTGGQGRVNASIYGTNTYASWTFRKQPKFFDVVTYTGNGGTPQNISHSLGSVPGFIIVKPTSITGGWICYHRSLTASGFNPAPYNTINLNSTGSILEDTGAWNSTAPTSTVFTIGSSPDVNTNGATYVAYLFAHNAGGFGLTGTDNVISCGSYTGNGSATGPTVTLGYEPQWVMIKNASNTGDWVMFDNMRGLTVGDGDAFLYANTSAAESTGATRVGPTSTGFYLKTVSSNLNTSGDTYIYIAIRRGPMKVPTSGTSVFSPNTANTSAGTPVVTNFPVDLSISVAINGDTRYFSDRLRGVNSTGQTANQPWIASNSTGAELTNASIPRGWDNTQILLPPYYAGGPTVWWNFRRAPNFFDEVCYTGTGSANTAFTHNLTVTPELMIVKPRSAATAPNWRVWSPINSTDFNLLQLSTNGAASSSLYSSSNVFPAIPTATTFTVGGSGSIQLNESGQTFVAYLFATCAGVSKCGTFTGNGSSQTINCGFTGGARFVMIKATSTTGDWMVADSARGIVSGSDPYLELNNTNAEVTGEDWLDTDSTGFVVNEVSGSNANTNGVTYIFLAIA